jgi:hypothetical protein
MQCYLERTVEEGIPPLTITTDGLSVTHLYILLGVLEGKPLGEIALSVGCTEPEIIQQIENQPLRSRIGEINKAIGKRILDGDFGVAAMFKQEAPFAARRIMAISRVATDLRIKFQANKEIITLAGFEPPKRIQIGVHHVLQEMSPEELDHFSTTGEWPDRLRERLQGVRSTLEEIKEVSSSKRPLSTTSTARDFEPLEEDE